MKNLILVLIIFFVNAAKAQNYVDSTAQWIQNYSWTGFTASTHCNYKYYFDGETIAANKVYLKMMQHSTCVYSHLEYDSLGNSHNVDTTYYSTNFQGFFREENSAFYFRVNDTVESRIYNFDVHDGLSFDSITQYSTCYPTNVQLMEHDTVCIANNARLRWRISMSTYPLANYYIEGVGPSSGFNAPICRNGCPECSYGLQYFILGNDTLYHSSCQINAENLVESIAQNNFKIISYGCYLNIAGDDLKRITIYNSTGQIQTFFGEIKTQNITINTTLFAQGIYVAKVENGKSVSFKKIFI